MDDKLFQQLFPKEQNSIFEDNIEVIKNRKKILELDKNDEDLNLFVPTVIEIFKKKCTIIWNAFSYPKLSDNNYKNILNFL